VGKYQANPVADFYARQEVESVVSYRFGTRVRQHGGQAEEGGISTSGDYYVMSGKGHRQKLIRCNAEERGITPSAAEDPQTEQTTRAASI
jgi:hypothetical protein